MITIFTTARAFRPPFDIIQRNAIASWLSLGSEVEIMLLGSDEGTAEVAAEFGVRHISDIDCNRFGAPLISSLFPAAESVARYDIMCFINADILLTDDFPTAVEDVVSSVKRATIIGRRWNLNFDRRWDFNREQSSSELRRLARIEGSLAPEGFMDYFVYPKGLWGEVPAFAVGAGRLDNWLVHRAVSLRSALVDATDAITAIHQNHDLPQRISRKYLAGSSLPGLDQNTRLMEDNWDPLWIGHGTVNECTHVLQSGGVKRHWRSPHLLRTLAADPRIRPVVAPIIRHFYPNGETVRGFSAGTEGI